MTFPLSARALLLSVVIFGAAACRQASPPAAGSSASPTPPAADPAGKPDTQGAVFGEGFYKEEANPAAVIRWVRRDAAFRLDAPTAGRYRLTFRAFTVFSNVENTVEVSVNGQAAGAFSAHAFDLSHPVSTTLEAPIRAGPNDVRLHSRGGETRLGEADDRTPAYGLVVPVLVEPLP